MLATRGSGGLLEFNANTVFGIFLKKNFNLVDRMISAGLFLGPVGRDLIEKVLKMKQQAC